MTREEAEEYVTAKAMPGNYGDFYESDADNLVDLIFDALESRTCENCKYFQDSFIGNVPIKDCETILVDYPPKDFGCVKFKRKEDDIFII